MRLRCIGIGRILVVGHLIQDFLDSTLPVRDTMALGRGLDVAGVRSFRPRLCSDSKLWPKTLYGRLACSGHAQIFLSNIPDLPARLCSKTTRRGRQNRFANTRRLYPLSGRVFRLLELEAGENGSGRDRWSSLWKPDAFPSQEDLSCVPQQGLLKEC